MLSQRPYLKHKPSKIGHFGSLVDLGVELTDGIVVFTIHKMNSPNNEENHSILVVCRKWRWRGMCMRPKFDDSNKRSRNWSWWMVEWAMKVVLLPAWWQRTTTLKSWTCAYRVACPRAWVRWFQIPHINGVIYSFIYFIYNIYISPAMVCSYS